MEKSIHKKYPVFTRIIKLFFEAPSAIEIYEENCGKIIYE